MKKSCETCEHAYWERTKTGKRKLNAGGTCNHPIKNYIPEPLARIININNISFAVNRDSGENCECYMELWEEEDR